MKNKDTGIVPRISSIENSFNNSAKILGPSSQTEEIEIKEKISFGKFFTIFHF